MRRFGLATLSLGSLGCLLLGPSACGDALVASPFGGGSSNADAGAELPAPQPDAGAPEDGPTIPDFVFGAPCVDDAQCEDGIECTPGVCDAEFGVCRFDADHSRCDDGVFCNGAERCDPRLGCRSGPPTSCSDSTPCTIDSCDEATRSCLHRERDLDGDGDVDANCQPGGDCNDFDPEVSSQAAEVCNNGRDDDCDGEPDERDCQAPRFDTCDDPLLIPAPGSYLVPSAGASLNYGQGCAPEQSTLRELVLAVDVPAGPAVDIDLLARTNLGELALGSAPSCGAAPSELECERGAYLSSGENVARLRLHGAAPGQHFVYLWSTAAAPIQLEASQLPATPAPANRSCDTALALQTGQARTAQLGLSGTALQSVCATERGDLFYSFSLNQPSDVRLSAQSLDELGLPRLSLRQGGCNEQEPGQELSCNEAEVALLRHHSLPAGTYTLALSASGPTEAQLVLQIGPPTAAPATDRCEGAPALAPNRSEDVSFVDHLNDIAAECSVGFSDAAWELELAEASDVLLLARFSSGDVGFVGLLNAACGEDDARECSRAGMNPARASEQGVPAGRYRVLMESALALPATLTAAVRPARARTLVPTSDACLEALDIGPDGGFFQGNTLNADNDFSASCDFATPNGSPDQLLRLVLDRPRRVLLDMRGSDFDTLLDVRRGPVCPGQELVGACAVGVAEDQSFLDLELPAGEYFIQIDGYAGALGAWFLDVFLMDP
jgi:hypothetical protein